jgi:hexosaminidase
MEATVHAGKPVFELTNKTRIQIEAGSPEIRRVGRFLHEHLSRQIRGLPPVSEGGAEGGRNVIRLEIRNADASLGEEGYTLRSDRDGIVIRATSGRGLFYGVQTLRQLLPVEMESATPHRKSWTVPAVTIRDKPLFAYRGQGNDFSRTFMPQTWVFHQLDLLALLKNNYYHMHLTDDQGWRVESKVYPQLHRKGSRWSPAAQDKFGGGYFTHQDIREIVAYARERYIEIVPEFDIPGHCSALLHAMPELGANPPRRSEEWPIIPYKDPGKTYGLSGEPLCPAGEHRYAILEKIVAEWAELFPGRILHLGGDEVPHSEHWLKDKDLVDLVARMGMPKSGDKMRWAVMGYFFYRMDQILAKYGKDMGAWTEMIGIHADFVGQKKRYAKYALRKDTVVYYWTGPPNDRQLGLCKAVWVPARHKPSGGGLYYDKMAVGDYRKPYRIRPFEMVESLSKRMANAKNFLGVQGQFWTHIARTAESIDANIYPSHAAAAEIGWTPEKDRAFEDFDRRMKAQMLKRIELIMKEYHGKRGK